MSFRLPIRWCVVALSVALAACGSDAVGPPSTDPPARIDAVSPLSRAAAVGSLTLLLGFFTRIAGGSLLRREHASRIVAASLVVGGAAAAVLALPLTLPGYVAAATVLGLAAGVPFARAFTGAAAARPDAPGAAVGFVNAWAALTIVAGTPLVGLTFSLPGDGRIGFVLLGVLAALAALATPR